MASAAALTDEVEDEEEAEAKAVEEEEDAAAEVDGAPTGLSKEDAEAARAMSIATESVIALRWN
jgi:hypothetical protein